MLFKILASSALIVAISAFSACTIEDYQSCEIPKTTQLQDACYPTETNPYPTCTTDYAFDCDSNICGVYKGSVPFCTQRCLPSSCNGSDDVNCKCPKGKTCINNCPKDGQVQSECVEWSVGTGEYFCLPANKWRSTT